MTEFVTPLKRNAIPGISVITKESAERFSPVPVNHAPLALPLKSLRRYWLPTPPQRRASNAQDAAPDRSLSRKMLPPELSEW